jgi:hypothetical protein
MPSTTETGHAKNVAYFHDLIAFCIGYGATYAPSRPDLRVGDLQTLETNALNSLADVLAKKTAFNNTVNLRMDAFRGIKALATRLINAIQATSATNELVKDAKTYNKKLQGVRAGKIETPTDPNAPVPVYISTSQQSYDQLIQHLSGLIEVLQSEPSYTPNEPDLQVPNLITYRNDLITKNNDVSTAHTDVSNSRINRDDILYRDPTGLIYIAQDVKMYIKSIFGASSDQYRQVKGIPFRRIKK